MMWNALHKYSKNTNGRSLEYSGVHPTKIFLFYFFSCFSLFGNGFNAWTTYQPYCAQTTSAHTDDCFSFSNVPEQKLEITTKESPTFSPFTRPIKTLATTTTRTTTTSTTKTPRTTTTVATVIKRPTSAPIAASTLTPFKPFKFTTFKPFSFFTSKPISTLSSATTELPSATIQFVNSYTTSTTRQPIFSEMQQTISTKLAFAPTFKPFVFTTPRIVASIGTTKAKKYSYAIYNSNLFRSSSTTTTERSTAAIISQSTTIKPSVPAKQFTNVFTNAKDAPGSSTPTKFNLFDLYLGRVSTKSPQRYVIPSFLPLPSQPIGHLSPYTRYTTQATPLLNAYSVIDMLTPKLTAIRSTTQKPTSEQVQQLFQSQVASIGQSLGIENSSYASLDSFITSPKGRVYRYSFSGTTKKVPSSQWIFGYNILLTTAGNLISYEINRF